jgi:SepF-like predicted cell division protein (DUF552 family)
MVFKEIFGKKEVVQHGGSMDIEEYISDLSIREGKIIERDDVIYVKPIELDGEGKGVGAAIKELEKGNIVLLNIRAAIENKTLLRSVIKEIKATAEEMDGDIVQLAPDKILVVPEGIKVMSRGEE